MNPTVRRRSSVSGVVLLVATLSVGFAAPAAAAAQTCNGREATIVGTSGADELHGTSGDDVIVGLGGKDFIVGRTGRDLICGGPGRDYLHGRAGWDHIYGGDGNDVIRGGRAGDRMYGNAGEDVIHGGQAFQTNEFYGGEGNDRLVGGVESVDAGAELFNGGLGDDVIRGGANENYVVGGLGIDDVDYAGSPYRIFSLVGCSPTQPGSATVDLTTGTFSAPAGQGTFTGGTPERVVGSWCDDVIIGTDDAEALGGGAGGDDRLEGRGGDDRLYAMNGRSTALSGGAGWDRILVGVDGATLPKTIDVEGGGGGDELVIESSSALHIDLSLGTVSGALTGSLSQIPNAGATGAGSHTLIGDAADNRLWSGTGSDKLYGRGGNDDLSSGPGEDEFWGEAGFDTIYASDDEGTSLPEDDTCAGERLRGCDVILTDTQVGG